MCGICGAYGLVDKNLLQKMCKTISHRGPDNEGYYFDSDVMLGMRRLKVIDLDTGNQPIYNEDKSIAVVFNGEIYNYKENREYLEKKGHSFYTNSDTETIVHLYEEFGDKCVEKLRGMFAFALWDATHKRLLIARDRIGIKPLYYYFENGVFIFASELKALLQYPALKKEINFHALHDYLTYMYIPVPDTIFNRVYKLSPGHILVCENGNIEIKKYWDVNGYLDKSANLFKDETAIAERMYELIRESVKTHLISDVPLGIFLSGGMDSGTIVAIMRGLTDSPIKTFSIGFEDNYYSELYNAKLVAKKFNTQHNEYILKPSSIEEIEDILKYFDEPFADSSAIPTYYVSKYSRGQVTVALSGDGGDEVFGGYGNYKSDKIGMLYRKLPTFLKDKAIPYMFKNFSESSGNMSKIDKIKKLFKIGNLSPEKIGRAHV